MTLLGAVVFDLCIYAVNIFEGFTPSAVVVAPPAWPCEHLVRVPVDLAVLPDRLDEGRELPPDKIDGVVSSNNLSPDFAIPDPVEEVPKTAWVTD